VTPLTPAAADQHRDLAGYWAGLSAGELRAPWCSGCCRFTWPPRPACLHCGAADLGWERLPETGRIFTWTVVHYTSLEDFRALTPYVVALIDVPEAEVRLVGHVRADPAAVDFGTWLTWRVDSGGGGVPAVFWIPSPEERSDG